MCLFLARALHSSRSLVCMWSPSVWEKIQSSMEVHTSCRKTILGPCSRVLPYNALCADRRGRTSWTLSILRIIYGNSMVLCVEICPGHFLFDGSRCRPGFVLGFCLFFLWVSLRSLMSISMGVVMGQVEKLPYIALSLLSSWNRIFILQTTCPPKLYH